MRRDRHTVAAATLGAVVALASLATAAPRGALTGMHLVFLDGATIDVGSIHGTGRTVVRRTFRMRIDGGAAAARFVRVYAAVHGATGHRVLLDGRALTDAPVLVDAATPLGVATAHTLELVVPASEPEGLLADSIEWLVEDAR